MAIEAMIGKYKKNNLIIIIVVLLGVGGWFAYDGYFGKGFIERLIDERVKIDTSLAFNKKAPFVMVPCAVAVVAYLFMIRGKKVVAGDDGIVMGSQRIAYDSIESVNKTFFKTKGYFVVTYKDGQGNEKELKLSDRTYDGLGILLDEIVAKIS